MATTSRPGVTFEATFNNGMTPTGGYWSQEGNSTPHMATMGGQSALQVDLNHYNDSNPSRTELVPRGMDSTYFDNGGFDAKMGQTYWYGMKTLIPSGFKSDGAPEIITQFHDYPDESKGEAWKSPAVDLTLQPWSDGTQHYMVSVRSDTKSITPAGGGDLTAGKYTSFNTYDLGKVSDSAGQWNEWVWKIKWGYDNTGDLELFRNGKLVLDLPNQGNCFNDQLGPYMKLGIYKWDWASGSDTGTSSRTVFYDDVRIAAGPNATYDSVAPTQKGTTAPPASTPTATPSPTPTTGDTKIVVNASGSAAGGQYAHFKLLVDGKSVGEGTTTGAAKDFTFNTTLSADQAHKVQVQYDNDAFVNGQDRNLIVNKVTINGHVSNATAANVTYDKGALDGKDVAAGQSHMWWNGTLVVSADKSWFPVTAKAQSLALAGANDMYAHVVQQGADVATATAPVSHTASAADLSVHALDAGYDLSHDHHFDLSHLHAA